MNQNQRRAFSNVQTLEEIEREHIQYVLEVAPTVTMAAEILGIDKSTLWRKRQKYGIKVEKHETE